MKVDHHAAVLALRGRYGLIRRSMERNKCDRLTLDTLDSTQLLLEFLDPSALSCESSQRAVWCLLAHLRAAPNYQAYASGVLVFLYSLNVRLTEPLKDELVSVSLS